MLIAFAMVACLQDSGKLPTGTGKKVPATSSTGTFVVW